ncbi:ATP-dependent 6-phosphofructokinase, muscle type-like [Sycon ciliatum]|uniref:ATP-dependent 6-phosphofructokinase n=1 Tax=Sycon ciliatum TaxID=27933 RepID=M5DEU6_9METZ|nr:phosphofructokinase [Sycon ciliatum]|eukprot:scpid37165/ scgid15235/ 6-phosphofructokinase, liver type; Phosphofructo-1-kinase isozyme B; Phosphofructokinase 1; Phosphohexokinase
MAKRTSSSTSFGSELCPPEKMPRITLPPQSPQPSFAVSRSSSPLTVELERRKCIAVMTSGGDSQGMNAALRGLVRMAMYRHARVFLIYEGYQGLVQGGDLIKETTWYGVSHIMGKGGTVIGTARCKEFRERWGRRAAALNLVKKRITNLIVIGGDGSLTGANLFREEWPELLQELVEEGNISAQEQTECDHLNIVGMVGSIDNDMCGTDMTLGADSALHRIVEAVDAISFTASSHQRCFVLEVMGRHCGYLALVSSLGCNADWCLIPESPPSDNWEKKMCEQLCRSREEGARMNLIIVAEGAVDRQGQPISSQYVKSVIEKELGYDTRITVLGHVQRGGAPSAYDRLMGCRVGAAAANAVLDADKDNEPVLVGLQGNRVVQSPLMKCVRETQGIAGAMKDGNFKEALSMRAGSFVRHWATFRRLSRYDKLPVVPATEKLRFALLHVGAPAAGVNTCTQAFFRLTTYHGHQVYAVHEGFDGLAKGSIQLLDRSQVLKWSVAGGSHLGTNRSLPSKEGLPLIAEQLKKHRINGLLVIGGFEAFHSLCILEDARKDYPAFCIPMLNVAATISNNVPGTDHSMGCDTALNIIIETTDRLKQSAVASRKRVFVIETMGGHCGFLATMGGLAGGADAAYIFEEKFTISDLQNDVRHLVSKFQQGIWRGIILRNEKCSPYYTTDFITNLYSAEGGELFTTRSNVLGHMQQGGLPSPYDRHLGVRFAKCSLDFFLDHCTLEPQPQCSSATACTVGMRARKTVFTPVSELKLRTDFKNRLPLDQWWLELRPLLRILAKHRDYHFKPGDLAADEIEQSTTP